ncbi:hypothetical protein SAMN02910358_00499 [Lachnospiraceae bacterium XBB1006]|nr:hypothetical protein SAMN02910358_00499 [Lachnospiraceae bacterium XBB1006]
MNGINRLFAYSQGRNAVNSYGRKQQNSANQIPEAENTTAKSKEMRQLLRALDQDSGTGITDPLVKGIWEQSTTTEREDTKKSSKPVTYNYREVSAKIRQAKTSQSAGQAVLAARRKVLDIRRKIASHDGDAEELQLALTHAKRMEMVARKKKHHLELEEMVVQTQNRDEQLDKIKNAATDMKNAMVTAEEETLSDREDAIFEEREKIMEDTAAELRETGAQNVDEMMENLGEMVAELGEEELKELEEAMEMLECMEVVDPHMSEEDLEELKRKHRAAENKAIMKADMDYLKGIIKHLNEKNVGIPGMNAGQMATSGAVSPVAVNVEAVIPATETSGGSTIDIQI